MKITNFLALGICLLFGSCTMQKSTVQVNDKGTEWEWNKGTIVVKTPERPAGQESVIGLALPKMEVVRVGFVGLGMRGPGAVSRFTYIPGTQIVALCDYEKERAEKCQKYLKEASLPKAAVYSGDKGYEELCKRDDIDLVYIATDWLHHFPVAKCALENGKNVAIEVPSAMNLKECWELVDLSEKNRKHCMILENCCYDWFEMNTLNMAQHGVFGEVIRAQGAYIHNLAPFWKHYWKKGEDDKLGWRLDYNMRHRGDVYATHGLGPVAQALNIHRGDRMETLVAMATKSVVGKDLVKENADSVCNSLRNGDHTTTLIRTANGKVIEIQHNVMTPQPYNRLYQLTGTKGFANKYPTQAIDVFTRTCCHTCCACATLHADTIITSIYHIVYDEYILTAGDINRITVLGIPRTFYGDSVDNHILASGRDDMEFRTIQKCNSLYEHILATGESDHVCSGFLLFVHILSHIRFVLQVERIPDVTLLI